MPPLLLRAQFVDDFSDASLPGWVYFTGDGEARMQMVQQNGQARISVDARHDRHNVWWAIIKRNIAPYLDLRELQKAGYELRVEARVKVSHAPRRLNIMINTQRTIDYHEHLREYDIADTSQWHTISMTTENLDIRPGDSLYVQLGLTDWGHGQYTVLLDEYRAEIVRVKNARPDLGEPLHYHPPVPALDNFSHVLPVAHDAVVHAEYPEVNFDNWAFRQGTTNIPVLSVATQQWVALRWDLDSLAGTRAAGAGILELTTCALQVGGDYSAAFAQDLGMEFGKIRVYEILGGDPDWEQQSVTLASLFAGAGQDEVVNGQMIFDTEVTPHAGGKTHITLSRPVMQRLLDGTTRGLLLRPLGVINASFHASEAIDSELAPKLYFNRQR